MLIDQVKKHLTIVTMRHLTFLVICLLSASTSDVVAFTTPSTSLTRRSLSQRDPLMSTPTKAPPPSTESVKTIAVEEPGRNANGEKQPLSSKQPSSGTANGATTPGTKAQSDSQNVFGVLSDTFTGVVFSLLHAFDDCGIEDSSKNLRVLWVRALLNYRGKIEDDRSRP